MTCKLTRRAAIAATVASGALSLAAPAWAEEFRRIPQRAGARVIVDNDFAGDPDGLVALAHHLLAPRARVSLITVSGLSPQFRPPGDTSSSVELGVTIAREVCTRLHLPVPPPVEAGAEPGDATPSAAARAIVAEALRDDPLPLTLACGGPLTNVATALRLAPQIAARMRVIWIGGGAFPDGAWEYNLSADIAAARTVIEDSGVELWTVPQPAYRLMQTSVAAMESDMRPISDFTRWLYDQFTQVPDFVELGGSWPMGDSPPVLLTAITPESSRARAWTARRINDDCTYGAEIPGRTINVYEDLDMRLTWEDFLARLRLHAAAEVAP